MFRKGKMLAMLSLCCILAAGAVDASVEEGILEDSPVEVTADIAVNSKYLWRGFMLDDDPVMQQGMYVSACGFTISVWGSMDIRADDSLNSDEVDYAVDYTYEGDRFNLSVGHTYYDFPPADASSKEFYVGVGLNAALSPTLTWFRDYGEEDSGSGDGDYVSLELGHSLPLGISPVSLDITGRMGYNSELFIDGEGGDIALGIGLNIPLTGEISFSPNVSYSMPYGDMEDPNDGNQDNEFYGGFSLTFDF